MSTAYDRRKLLNRSCSNRLQPVRLPHTSSFGVYYLSVAPLPNANLAQSSHCNRPVFVSCVFPRVARWLNASADDVTPGPILHRHRDCLSATLSRSGPVRGMSAAMLLPRCAVRQYLCRAPSPAKLSTPKSSRSSRSVLPPGQSTPRLPTLTGSRRNAVTSANVQVASGSI